MTDHPIVLTGPEVRAVLREIEAPGTGKTQMRVPVTRLRKHGAITEFGPSDTPGYDWHFRDREKRWHDYRDSRLMAVLPYAVRDRLWGRETHCFSASGGFDAKPGYDADTGANSVWYRANEAGQCDGPWRSASQMRRQESRLTLIVTDVRVQRLLEISEKDARAEGIRGNSGGAWGCEGLIEDYADAWDARHAKRGHGWEANDWVAAYTFTPHLCNIDQMPAGG